MLVNFREVDKSYLMKEAGMEELPELVDKERQPSK